MEEQATEKGQEKTPVVGENPIIKILAIILTIITSGMLLVIVYDIGRSDGLDRGLEIMMNIEPNSDCCCSDIPDVPDPPVPPMAPPPDLGRGLEDLMDDELGDSSLLDHDENKDPGQQWWDLEVKEGQLKV